MSRLACFQPDAPSRARLHTVLGGSHEVVFFSDWRSLREGLDRQAFDAVVVDPYDPWRPVGTAELEGIRSRHAGIAIVVHTDFRGREAELFTLGRLGVDAVLPCEAGSEPGQRIRETLSQALANAVAMRVLAALGGRLRQRGSECLRWCIENGHRSPTVLDLARAFRSRPRTMARLLRDEGGPAPGRLLLWGKLFLAARMLSDEGASVERVALAIGYSSGAALTRSIRLACGYPPREMRRRGALGLMTDAFVQRELRRPAPRRRVRWLSAVRGGAQASRKERAN